MIWAATGSTDRQDGRGHPACRLDRICLVDRRLGGFLNQNQKKWDYSGLALRRITGRLDLQVPHH